MKNTIEMLLIWIYIMNGQVKGCFGIGEIKGGIERGPYFLLGKCVLSYKLKNYVPVLL